MWHLGKVLNVSGGQALCSFLGPASSRRPGVQTREPLGDTAFPLWNLLLLHHCAVSCSGSTECESKLHRICISAVEPAAASPFCSFMQRKYWVRVQTCIWKSNSVTPSWLEPRPRRQRDTGWCQVLTAGQGNTAPTLSKPFYLLFGLQSWVHQSPFSTSSYWEKHTLEFIECSLNKLVC